MDETEKVERHPSSYDSGGLVRSPGNSEPSLRDVTHTTSVHYMKIRAKKLLRSIS